MVLRFTSTCETIDPTLFGTRDDLADAGFGFSLAASPSFTYDILGHDARPQLYGGQRPTFDRSVTATLTYDVSRLGLPGDAQLTVAGAYSGTNYRNGTPSYAAFTTLAIYQRFANGNVELLTGYYPLIRQIYGIVLGGNASAAALGPSSVIPFQVGVSAFTPVPAATLKITDPKTHLYNTAIIARSISPEGVRDEADRNTSGLRFSMRGDKPLLVDEFGYKVAAGPGRRAVWLRGGAIYNLSNYALWRGGRSKNNYAFYLAATYQLTQPDGGPRGLNLDVKLDYAPSDRNLYNKDAQVTAFYIGPFASRPYDMTSLGVTHNFFSKTAVRTVEASVQDADKGSTAASMSYAFRVTHGLYWVSGLTYTKHPTFAPHRPDALLLQQSVNIAF